MADNGFNSTVQSLFKGLEGFLTTKTVVGDAVKFDDGTIILPLVDVTFGAGAGAFSGNSSEKGKNGTKNNAGGGMGGKIQPSAILVIKDGQTKLVNVKNQDGMTKILDMIPEFIDKYAPSKKGKAKKNKADKAVSGEEKQVQDVEDVVTDYVEEEEKEKSTCIL